MSEPNAPNYWKSRADAVEVENVTLRRRLEEAERKHYLDVMRADDEAIFQASRTKYAETRLEGLKPWLLHHEWCAAALARADKYRGKVDGDESACTCGLAKALGSQEVEKEARRHGLQEGRE